MFFQQLNFLLSTEQSHQWVQVNLQKYAPRDTNLIIKKTKNESIYRLVYSIVWDVLLFHIIWIRNQVLFLFGLKIINMAANVQQTNSDDVSVKCGKMWDILKIINSLILNLRNPYVSLDYLSYPELCYITVCKLP